MANKRQSLFRGKEETHSIEEPRPPLALRVRSLTYIQIHTCTSTNHMRAHTQEFCLDKLPIHKKKNNNKKKISYANLAHQIICFCIQNIYAYTHF